MPADVELSRREGIELIHTGSWGALTGTWKPTRADILAAVEAQQCPAVRRPRLKLGHTDTRFNSGGDGEPALGWIENLRATDDGNTLVGDQVALPWLSAVQAAAYPDRSIEGNYRHVCALGHTHPFVLTAVALLGVTPPAVSTLKSVQDLPAMLGVAASSEVPEGAEHVQVTVLAAGFDEGKHQRDGDGQFARTSGGDGSRQDGSAPAHGDAALTVPPLNLADMDRSGPRAQALWFRTGDNSMETGDYPGFIRLNEHMREGGWDSKMDGYITDIDAAMVDSVLPEPIRVFRGIEASALGTPGQLEGVEFTDKAFASTTTDEKHARTFGSIMTIRVPAGTSAIRMADRDPNLVESEILLDRDLRYRVVREVLELGPGNIPTRHDIEVEVVAGGSIQAATAKPGKATQVTADDLQRAKYVWAPGDITVLGEPEPVEAAAEVHTGAMVALIPTTEDAARLAVDGGEPADQLHVTLAYLGEAADLDVTDRQRIIAGVSTAVQGMPQVEAQAFALSAFNPPGMDTSDGRQRDTCITLGMSGDLLDTVHNAVSAALDGGLLAMQHRPWCAHITLAYTDDLTRIAAWADRCGPVMFDRVRIALAGEHIDIPLIGAGVAASTVPPPELPALVLPAAEPEPVTPTEEDLVSLSDDMRSRLGLADDADEAAALAAIDELKTRADKPAEPSPEMVAASAAATAQAQKAVAAHSEMQAELSRLSGELASIKASAATSAKSSLFDGAIQQGKIKPAERQSWEGRYDKAPDVITEILASIAPGTAVPVMASGTVGSPEPEQGSDDDWDDIISRLDGPTANKGA